MRRFLRSMAEMTAFQFRQLYRNKISFFFNLIFPLLLVALFGSLFGQPAEDATVSVGIARTAGDTWSEALAEAVKMTDLYTVEEGTVEDLEEALSKGQVSAVAIIPAGEDQFLGGAEALEGATILYDPVSPKSGRTAAELKGILDGISARMQGVNPAVFADVQPVAGDASLGVFDYLMPGQMALMLLSAGLITVAVSVAQQRESGSMRHLFSTPLPVTVWAAARISANLLMSLFQLALLFAFAGLLYKVEPPANLSGTIVLVFLSSLAALGMGLAIGTTVKGEETAVAVTMPIFMLLIFLGNVAFPLEDPPPFIAAIFPYVPSYRMTEALRAVMRDGAPLSAVSSEIAVLSSLALLFLGFALWRVRRQYVDV